MILDLLKKGILLKEDGRFNKEAYIHKLIYPMRRTSEEIEYKSHNLWLIDERLAYCDITPNLKKIAELHDFIETPDKLGLYRYHEKKKSYIEILSYDKMINDAEKRNRILFDKLGI